MTEQRAPQPVWTLAAIAAVIVVAFLARSWAYFTHPTWSHPTSYDDGVYFAAAAAWVRGHWPYRDFALVHPPGLLLGYGLPALASKWIGIRAGFIVARWYSCAVGAAVAGLVALAAGRMRGVVAALIAGLAYAFYPEAAEQDRSVYLEPLLNLFCVAASVLWVTDEREPTRTRAAWAGVLYGFALLLKLWAGPWIALAVAYGLARRRRTTKVLIVAAALTTAIIAAPFLLHAPAAFFDQVWWMQLRRPPDGMPRADRLFALIEQHKALSIVAWLTAAASFAFATFRRRSRTPAVLYWSAALALVAAMFLAAKAYWNVYNGHLAAPECVVASIGVVSAAEWISLRFRQPWAAAGLALAASVVTIAPMVRANWRMLKASDTDTPLIGDFLRATVPPGDCVAALEPASVLAADQLPGFRPGSPTFIDSYGAMLAVGSTEKHTSDLHEVFSAGSAQTLALDSLMSCRYLLTGWREELQLTQETRAAIHAAYAPMGDALPASAVLERKSE